MKIESLLSFPAGDNPFCYDAFHMGMTVGSNVIVMMPNHSREECPYLIIVNTVTGERIRVSFKNADKEINHANNVDRILKYGSLDGNNN